jgi:uncharacterized membrane protein
LAYLLGKLIHLFAVILWIGPPLGAYYLVFSAYRSKDQDRLIWAERCAEQVLIVEHIAFVVLIASGAYLVWLSGGTMLAMPWLQKKLYLFAGVFAFELYDIAIAHVFLHRLLKQPNPLVSPEWPRAERHRKILAALCAIVALVLIPGIFYFAIAKQ